MLHIKIHIYYTLCTKYIIALNSHNLIYYYHLYHHYNSLKIKQKDSGRVRRIHNTNPGMCNTHTPLPQTQPPTTLFGCYLSKTGLEKVLSKIYDKYHLFEDD